MPPALIIVSVPKDGRLLSTRSSITERVGSSRQRQISSPQSLSGQRLEPWISVSDLQTDGDPARLDQARYRPVAPTHAQAPRATASQRQSRWLAKAHDASTASRRPAIAAGRMPSKGGDGRRGEPTRQPALVPRTCRQTLIEPGGRGRAADAVFRSPQCGATDPPAAASKPVASAMRAPPGDNAPSASMTDSDALCVRYKSTTESHDFAPCVAGTHDPTGFTFRRLSWMRHMTIAVERRRVGTTRRFEPRLPRMMSAWCSFHASAHDAKGPQRR